MIRLEIVGGGRMGEALLGGLLAAGWAAPSELAVVEKLPERRAQLAEMFPGVAVLTEPAAAEVAVVSVKPNDVADTCRTLATVGVQRVLSIAAGVTTAALADALGEGIAVVRAMPNTPALVGASASAYAVGSSATRADAEVVQEFLGSVGLAMEVKEKLLDAVTGVSGSGPAYGFLMIEALADGGVAAGLPRDIAQRLAAQTLLGAAKMVLETGQHPGALKDAVCSPGGTTIEAIHALERGGVRAALIGAVRAAADKAKAMA